MVGGVIYLDTDDEITSAAARIRAVEEDRVAVVLPFGSRLASSRINFRLLARDAQDHHKVLSVVAGDAGARALAAAAGLPTYVSIAEYERASASPDRPGSAVGQAGDVGRTAAGPMAGASLDDTAGAADTGSVTIEHPSRPGAGEPSAGPRSGAAGQGSRRSGGPRTRVAPAERDRRRGPLLVGLAVLVLAVVVGGVAAFLLLPSASVVVTAREESIGPLSITVAARTDVASPDVSTGVVPAHAITIDVDASDTFPATGIRVQETRADGVVRFLSKDFTAPNTVAAGSIVRTGDGVRFRTQTTIRIAPASLNGLQITPSTASVRVSAVDPGPAGNVPARTITNLPKGENPLFLEVTNLDPTSGGARNEFQRVTQQDIDAAVAALTATLRTSFQARAADPNLTTDGSTVFAETAQPGDPVIATDPNDLIGQEVATFDLAASLSGSVTAVDTAQIRSVAEARLRAAVGPGARLVPGSIVIEPQPAVVLGQSVAFPVSAAARQTASLDGDAIKRAIMGRTLDEARTILQRYGPATITLWPDWVTSVPTIDSRVTLAVEGEPSGSGPVDSAGSARPDSARSASSSGFASPSGSAAP